jgi:uridine kinase
VPVYDISRDARSGRRRLSLGEARHFVAEGIFAQEMVAECVARGLLADAICLHHHRTVTFWRRLRRDLRERRKPPMLLLRRGLALMRAEPDIVAHAAALGCTPVTSHQAHERILRLLVSVHPG